MDIAEIGFRADTSDLADAKVKLDALAPSAAKVEAGATKVENSLNKIGDAAQRAAAGMTSGSVAMERAAGVTSGSAASINAAASASDNLARRSNNLMQALFPIGVAMGKVNAQIDEARMLFSQGALSLEEYAGAMTVLKNQSNILVGQQSRFQQSLLDTKKNAGLASYEMLNLSRQFADIGVTAAMGMNPLMILIQQGPQIAETFQTAATRGVTFSAALSALGVKMGLLRNVTAANIVSTEALAAADLELAAAAEAVNVAQSRVTLGLASNADKLALQTAQTRLAAAEAAKLDLAMSGTAVAGGTAFTGLAVAGAVLVGVIAAVVTGWALGTREINKNNKDLIDGLGLTEKQLERVKKSGVDTTVTMGDSFKAFFEVLGDRLSEAFAPQLEWLSKAWNKMLDGMTAFLDGFIKGFIGTFVGAYHAVKSTWSLLPSAFGDIIIQAANVTISFVEKMINKIIEKLNVVIDYANKGAEKVGLSFRLDHIGDINIDPIANKYAGAAKKAANAAVDGFKEGFNEYGKAQDRFFSDVSKRAVKDRSKLIRDAAGDAEKTPKGPKTAGQKFDDIVTGAQNDIAAQKAREAAAGIEMTAQASAALEEKTKLLAAAQSQGIKLTDAMKNKIDELAEAYGRAKVAADNAVALKDILKTSEADIAGIKTQIDMIGLYGRELAYATEMAKLFGEAKSKGMTPEAIAAATPQFQNQANKVADASVARDSKKFMEDQRQEFIKNNAAIDMQTAALGMSKDELIKYQYEQKALNDALAQHVELSASDIEVLMSNADALANNEINLRKMSEAYEFSKGIFKGFFSDMRSGLEQGQTIWQSFANTVINALQRILDKILDSALESAFNSLWDNIGGGGSGGGLGSALAGLFSAKGNVFDHGVSAFAKGGSFTNSVVTSPTAFAFGKGGANLGIMGEAGPEAVMPLKRGPDGSLGVQMYNGRDAGRGSNSPAVIELRVTAEEGDMFKPRVEAIAEDKAVNITQVGLKTFNDQLPERFKQIANDERAR